MTEVQVNRHAPLAVGDGGLTNTGVFNWRANPSSASRAQALASDLAKIYAQDEGAARRFGSTFRMPIDESLRLIEASPPRDLSVESLYQWSEDAKSGVREKFLALHELLLCLPPQTVSRAFGRETLLWTMLYSDLDRERGRAVADHLLELGVNVRWFQVALDTNWTLARSSTSIRHVAKQFELFETLQSGAFKREDFALMLDKHRSGEAPLKLKQLECYKLEAIALDRQSVPFRSKGWHYEWQRKRFDSAKGPLMFKIYMDAPTGMLLLYKGQPTAIGVFFARGEETLFVNQIQGLRGTLLGEGDTPLMGPDRLELQVGNRGAARLKVKELMLDLCTDFARAVGFSQIVLQGAENNNWINSINVNLKPDLSLEAAIETYNAIPAKMGFVRDEQNNWVKAL